MGSEYMGPLPDPDKQPPLLINQPLAAPQDTQNPTHQEEDTQPRRSARSGALPAPSSQDEAREPSYREHVSGQLFVLPSEAPNFRPASPPYPGYVQKAQKPQEGQQAEQNGQEQKGQWPAPYPNVPRHPDGTPISPANTPGYTNGGPQAGTYPNYANGYAPQARAYPGYVSGYAPQAGASPGYANGYAPQAGGYPGYPAYPGYAPQVGTYPGYPGYPAYPAYGYYPPFPYGWYAPPQPKRDGYTLGISIAAFTGSLLALLGGVVSGGLLLLMVMVASTTGRLATQQQFSGMTVLSALAIAGLVGGGFSLYHSIRALFFKKPSVPFKLPWFWVFLSLYILVIAVGFLVSGDRQIAVNSPITIFLIAMSGILPALTILALAVRRVRHGVKNAWPTTWRRFTLAIASGATSAVLLASIFELILTLIAGIGLRVSAFSIDNPNMPMPQNIRLLLFMFILVSAIAPLVEETVKPLAAVALIGRMRSAGEAFVLGLSCGIGFDLIETIGYISQGYHQWIETALERSAAGLLHGFGAGMVALGWYYLTHRGSLRKNRILIALGCGIYALLQHAIWNGSFGLALLPAPIGSFFDNGTIMIGSYAMPGLVVAYIVETVLMLIFFFFVTGKLRSTAPTPDQEAPKPLAQPMPEPRVPLQVSSR